MMRDNLYQSNYAIFYITFGIDYFRLDLKCLFIGLYCLSSNFKLTCVIFILFGNLSLTF